MLTLAISLLLTAGAAFALLVIVAMLTANRQAILSALQGKGAFGAATHGAGAMPPQMATRIQVGALRRGRAHQPHRAVPFNPLRAAA